MGTKLTELRDGCFHAAMDDEPMFVLLARDPDAPRVVRNWASAREDDIDRGARPASDRAKVAEARATADKMERWRKDNDGAWRDGLFADPPAMSPHTPAPKPAQYSFRSAADMRYHLVRQESDEWACSCGKRWDVAEGEIHP